mmetsp:Transcript_29050/g.52192  ORF Transcript_29050/g.52192 Transcript_29050/m.52192 type:complete len:201 (+) Transcript_29050:599-1201(+)
MSGSPFWSVPRLGSRHASRSRPNRCCAGGSTRSGAQWWTPPPTLACSRSLETGWTKCGSRRQGRAGSCCTCSRLMAAPLSRWKRVRSGTRDGCGQRSKPPSGGRTGRRRRRRSGRWSRRPPRQPPPTTPSTSGGASTSTTLSLGPAAVGRGCPAMHRPLGAPLPFPPSALQPLGPPQSPSLHPAPHSSWCPAQSAGCTAQ